MNSQQTEPDLLLACSTRQLLGHDVPTYLATYVGSDDQDADDAGEDVGELFADDAEAASG